MSHFKAKMHQIRFPASVPPFVRSFQTPSKRRADGRTEFIKYYALHLLNIWQNVNLKALDVGDYLNRYTCCQLKGTSPPPQD